MLAYIIGTEGIKLGLLDSSGRTAIHLAARNSHAQAVFMLLDAGGIALAERQDGEGTTAVHFAAVAGEENIIRVLVQVRSSIALSRSFSPHDNPRNHADENLMSAGWMFREQTRSRIAHAAAPLGRARKGQRSPVTHSPEGRRGRARH